MDYKGLVVGGGVSGGGQGIKLHRGGGQRGCDGEYFGQKH